MNNPAHFMPFSKLMGIDVTEFTEDKIVGVLNVRDDLCTAGGIMHGGAIMAFADSLGGLGAARVLPEGAKGTTTVESKTNFLGPAPKGEIVIGTCTPIKVGRRLSIWQTEIKTEKGKLVALVTQTQMVL